MIVIKQVDNGWLISYSYDVDRTGYKTVDTFDEVSRFVEGELLA